jgi:3-deoxy-D-manno-octulosonic-acid transferase
MVKIKALENIKLANQFKQYDRRDKRHLHYMTTRLHELFAGASSSKRAFSELLQAKLTATHSLRLTIIPRHSSSYSVFTKIRTALSHTDKKKSSTNAGRRSVM